MSEADRWDDRYASSDYVFGTNPAAFLVEQADWLPPQPEILAVADGEGRNGVWLAEQGHRVVSIDVSAQGLRRRQSWHGTARSRSSCRLRIFQTGIGRSLASTRWSRSSFSSLILPCAIQSLPGCAVPRDRAAGSCYSDTGRNNWIMRPAAHRARIICIRKRCCGQHLVVGPLSISRRTIASSKRAAVIAACRP